MSAKAKAKAPAKAGSKSAPKLSTVVAAASSSGKKKKKKDKEAPPSKPSLADLLRSELSASRQVAYTPPAIGYTSKLPADDKVGASSSSDAMPLPTPRTKARKEVASRAAEMVIVNALGQVRLRGLSKSASTPAMASPAAGASGSTAAASSAAPSDGGIFGGARRTLGALVHAPEAAAEPPAAAPPRTPPLPPKPPTPPPPPKPPTPPPPKLVRVRYNHYNQEFPLDARGRLSLRSIDEAYCIAYVFKGKWDCVLTRQGREYAPEGFRIGKDAEGEVAAFGSFANLEAVVPDGMGGARQAEYLLEVHEDPTQSDAPRKAYVPSSSSSGLGGRVLAGSDENNTMGEDSSTCSCLYGNPCVSAYNCKDWHNRFEVAKRNGWKGFS